MRSGASLPPAKGRAASSSRSQALHARGHSCPPGVWPHPSAGFQPARPCWRTPVRHRAGYNPALQLRKHENHIEFENLKSQIVTSNWGGARRALPYAFTEQGVAMLSGVLRSGRAVQVNIAVMRAFVQLRQLLGSQAELARKFTELEQRIEGHDAAIRSLFDAIRQLMAPPPPPPPRPEIGFHVKEEAVPYRTRRRPRLPIHPS